MGISDVVNRMLLVGALATAGIGASVAAIPSIAFARGPVKPNTGKWHSAREANDLIDHVEARVSKHYGKTIIHATEFDSKEEFRHAIENPSPVKLEKEMEGLNKLGGRYKVSGMELFFVRGIDGHLYDGNVFSVAVPDKDDPLLNLFARQICDDCVSNPKPSDTYPINKRRHLKNLRWGSDRLKAFERGCTLTISKDPFNIGGVAVQYGMSKLTARLELPPDLARKVKNREDTDAQLYYGYEFTVELTNTTPFLGKGVAWYRKPGKHIGGGKYAPGTWERTGIEVYRAKPKAHFHIDRIFVYADSTPPPHRDIRGDIVVETSSNRDVGAVPDRMFMDSTSGQSSIGGLSTGGNGSGPETMGITSVYVASQPVEDVPGMRVRESVKGNKIMGKATFYPGAEWILNFFNDEQYQEPFKELDGVRIWDMSSGTDYVFDFDKFYDFMDKNGAYVVDTTLFDDGYMHFGVKSKGMFTLALPSNTVSALQNLD